MGQARSTNIFDFDHGSIDSIKPKTRSSRKKGKSVTLTKYINPIVIP